jgi:hypothetical protein
MFLPLDQADGRLQGQLLRNSKSVDQMAGFRSHEIDEGGREDFGHVREVDALESAAIRKQRSILGRQQGCQNVHVLRRTDREPQFREPNIDPPSDSIPIRTGRPELGGLWRFVRMGHGKPDRLDKRVGKGEHCVGRCDLSHEVVEGIANITLLSLRRPEVSAAYFMAVGLVLVYPPVAHG